MYSVCDGLEGTGVPRGAPSAETPDGTPQALQTPRGPARRELGLRGERDSPGTSPGIELQAPALQHKREALFDDMLFFVRHEVGGGQIHVHSGPGNVLQACAPRSILCWHILQAVTVAPPHSCSPGTVPYIQAKRVLLSCHCNWQLLCPNCSDKCAPLCAAAIGSGPDSQLLRQFHGTPQARSSLCRP